MGGEQCEDICCRVRLGDAVLGKLAGEDRGAAQGLEVRTLGPRADEQRADVCRGHRPQQHVEAFLGHEPRDADHNDLLGQPERGAQLGAPGGKRVGPLCPGRDVDRVREDAYVCGIGSQRDDGVAGERPDDKHGRRPT